MSSEEELWPHTQPEPQSPLEIAADDDAPKNVLTAPNGDVTGQSSPPGFGRLVGEMVVRFYEDDGLDVQFPNLGLITVGRLEKSIPYLYNRLHLARQMDYRKQVGQPENFNISTTDQ